MNTIHATIFLAAAMTACASGWADSLELADGTVLEGDFVGSSNGIVMFNTGSEIEAFRESEVVGVYFSEGVATASQRIESPPPTLTVPAGTRLTVRTVEDVNTDRHGAGHRFRAQLEGALVVDGVTVVPRGTVLYGRITQSTSSGRMVGSANLSLEFTDIMIGEELIPIVTTELTAQGGSEGARTLGRTARAAAIGGLIDGRSGARTGAKVGAGVSILTTGSSINVPRSTLLDTTLRAPLSVPG